MSKRSFEVDFVSCGVGRLERLEEVDTMELVWISGWPLDQILARMEQAVDA